MSAKPTYEELEKRVQELERAEFDRKLAEDALQEDEKCYRVLFNMARDIVFIHGFSPKGTPPPLLEVNDIACELLGYSKEEMLNLTPLDIISERDLIHVPEEAELLNARKELLFEKILITKSGKPIPVEINTRLFERGNQTFAISIARDITERKRAVESLRESEEKFRSAFENSAVGMVLIDQEGRYLRVNKAMSKILGYTEEELLSMTIRDISYPGEATQESDFVKQLWTGESDGFAIEKRYIHKDGHIVCGAITVSPIHDAIGKTNFILGQLQDITERKRAEQAVRANEDFLKTLINAIPIPVFSKDRSGRYLEFNNAFETFFGETRERLIGKTVYDINPPELAQLYHAKDNELFESRVVQCYESQVKNAHGELRDVIFNKAVFTDSQGSVNGLIGAILDITERNLTVDALRKSEERLRSLVDNAVVGIYQVTHEGRFLFVNRKLAQMFGFENPQEFLNVCSDISLLYVDPEARQSLLKELKAKGYVEGKETQFRHRDGHIKWFRINARVFEESHQESINEGFLVDITEQKVTEQERVLLATAISQAAEIVEITDSEANIQYVNPAFERITGYSRDETIGHNPSILKSGKHSASFYKSMWETLANRNNWSGRFINKKKNGTLYTEEASISPVIDADGNIRNYVAVKRDITDELKKEEQLLQSQKMEAIGTLAGGIAHDFNNILYSIIGYAEMGVDKTEHNGKAQKYFREILIACNRAVQLTKNILAFCRREEPVMKPIRIQPIIDEIFHFMRSSIPSTIQIIKRIDPECGLVMGDPAQIHQILANLFTNAFHAIQDVYGQITVGLTEADIESGYHVSLKPGRYVRLSVSDDGCGIKIEEMERIFDPYFTTKEPGKGSGLGLSIVQGIIKNHNGEITAYSEPGKGSTFNVYFPELPENTNVIENQIERLAQPTSTGKENILLVDDDPSVVKMLNMLLEDIGYHVVPYTDSQEALHNFRLQPEKYDVVITDMTMPQMSGDELSKEILKIRPDIPIILCTGFNESINEAAAKAIGIREFIMKPVEKRKIAQLIRKVMDD